MQKYENKNMQKIAEISSSNMRKICKISPKNVDLEKQYTTNMLQTCKICKHEFICKICRNLHSHFHLQTKSFQYCVQRFNICPYWNDVPMYWISAIYATFVYNTHHIICSKVLHNCFAQQCCTMHIILHTFVCNMIEFYCSAFCSLFI